MLISVDENITLSDRLLSILSSNDYSETCRERATTCLYEILSLADETADTLNAKDLFYKMTNIFVARFESNSTKRGRLKPAEEAEEIRLYLVKIMNVIANILLDSNAIDIEHNIATESSLLQCISKFVLQDDYPDLKREGCILVQRLSLLFPKVVVMNMESLLNVLIGPSVSRPRDDEMKVENDIKMLDLSRLDLGKAGNALLRHRHAKTRSLALETLAAVVECNAKDGESLSTKCLERLLFQVIPNIEAVAPFDKSVNVRTTLANTMVRLLNLFPRSLQEGMDTLHKNECESNFQEALLVFERIVILIILCVIDETDAVPENLNEALQSAGNISIQSIVAVHSIDLTSLFLSRIQESKSVHELQKYLTALSFVLTSLKKEEENGNCPVSLTNSTIEKIPNLMKVMCSVFSTDDKSIFQAANKCMHELGHIKEVKHVAVKWLLNTLSCNSIEKNATIAISSAGQCTSILRCLAALLHPLNISSNDVGYQELEQTMIILAGRDVVAYLYESQSASFAALSIVRNIVEYVVDNSSGPEKLIKFQSIIQRVILCSSYLMGCRPDFNLTDPCQQVIAQLAPDESISVDEKIRLVINRNFKQVLLLITSDVNERNEMCWEYDEPGMYAFSILVRLADGNVIADNFNDLAPIFETHLHTPVQKTSRNDDEMHFQRKIFFMGLLQAVLSKDSLEFTKLHNFIEKLIQTAIISNIVWRSGAPASSLRKISTAVLFTLVSSGGLSQLALCRCAPTLLPTLNSSISDDDSSTREISMATMTKLLESLPGKLGSEAISKICPELLKALDEDSNENVRRLSCDSLQCILKMNQDVSIFESIVKSFLLHIDDDSPLQEKLESILLDEVYTVAQTDKDLLNVFILQAKLALESNTNKAIPSKIFSKLSK